MSDELWLAESVTGHRSWTLNAEQMRLESAFGPWTTGFLEARCHQFGHESPNWPAPQPEPSHWSFLHPDGASRCLCGINAYKLDEPLAQWLEATQVVGIVDLGGRVHEYEYGYRAQYGRIAEATIITAVPYGSRFLGYLQDKYEAPFRAMSWTEYKTEWETTHGRDWKAEEEDQDADTGAEEDDDSIASYAGAFTLRTSLPAIQAPRGTISYKPAPLTVEAVKVTNRDKTRWQPALSDGRRLYKYLSLTPEWKYPHWLLSNHRPLLYRWRGTALRKAKRYLKPLKEWGQA